MEKDEMLEYMKNELNVNEKDFKEFAESEFNNDLGKAKENVIYCLEKIVEEIKGY